MENNAIPVTQCKGVGEKTARLLEKLDIHTVQDLVLHMPRDYEVYGEPVSIAEAPAGETCAVYAQVTAIPNVKKVRSLTILNVDIRDASGVMSLTFFNMPYLKNVLKPGGFYLFRGLVKQSGTRKEMEQPKLFALDAYQALVGRLLPRYTLTKGISNAAMQKYIQKALDLLPEEAEYYPEDLMKRQRLVSRKTAFRDLHFPSDEENMLCARRRLVFDEFFAFLLLLRKNRELAVGTPNAFRMFETADTVRFIEQLPFPLTKAQRKVWQEIRNDLGRETVMNRLIQGDVGSGKTILAVLALLECAANGYQGALMAPTEVLAAQHFETITGYVTQYGIAFRPVLLIGSMTAMEKKEAYARIASGEANLIIGTHALIQDKVEYHSLALVVTDEQHRFGVRQRESLAKKGQKPHVLVMSATPIPRTLAIILYGDLDVSIVDELPANRLPIKNCVVGTSFRPKAYSFLAKECVAGHQAYVICPMVEAGEDDGELENVVDYTQKLRDNLPNELQVAYLHGRMRSAQKNQIMEDFAAHRIDVLVSTTVIEVGINVPNATLMMVENAERFGLAQLHQLRGRVGRGDAQSYCIFISTSDKQETLERLDILNHSNDGFAIASKDLAQRGPGDLFGVRQSGEFSFVLGDIYTDAAILKEASEEVNRLLSEDPELTKEEHQPLLAHFSDNRAGNAVDFRTI